MRTLLTLMLKEEYRLHTSYSGKRAFITFPAMIFIFSLFAAIASKNVIYQMGDGNVVTTTEQMTIIVHLSIFLYGISVGAFGFLGRQYIERRYSRSNFLISMPTILPISFKKTFLALYLRDVIFYTLLIIVPMGLGFFASVPMTHFRFTSIALFFLSLFLSFLLGLSFSFLISVIYTRSMPLFITSVLCIMLLLLGYGIFHFVPINLLLPSLGFQFSIPPFAPSLEKAFLYLLVSTLTIMTSTFLAVQFISESVEIKQPQSRPIFPQVMRKLERTGAWAPYLAKEFVELRRSGTYSKMFFSFIAPLIFLTVTIWFVNYGLKIPMGFNTVFYAAMIGFFGVLLYSWMTNMDIYEYFSTLPVTAPKVIKVKYWVFLFLSIVISSIFVIGVCIVNREFSILWLALLIMVVVSAYMGAVTAYLTGLRTNTFLFDFGVLVKFAIMSFLPNICLTILSFGIYGGGIYTFIGIALVLVVLLYSTRILYNGIENRWEKEEFR